MNATPMFHEYPMRPAQQVMQLPRLGSLHASRMSFTRSLVRKMANEAWRVERTRFDLDAQGHGVAIYTLTTPAHRYQAVVFSHDLAPDRRSDRVIAEAWDVTFALVEGEADDALLSDMAANVPLQEAGRQQPKLLVLSRANKSLRTFDAFLNALASGQQPDPSGLTQVGYLYRTTAVYGNGKFGIADYARLLGNPDFNRPFAAQMFAVYLLRHFSIDQINHLARHRSPDTAVPLAPALQRYLGIGNSTGLGMAPFLINHPQLVQQWVWGRERALSLVQAQPSTRALCDRLHSLIERALRHFAQTHTEDEEQRRRNRQTVEDLGRILHWLQTTPHSSDRWVSLTRWAEQHCELETQELINTLLIELYPEIIDGIEDDLGCPEDMELQPDMSIRELIHVIETRFRWALSYDPDDPDHNYWFWYRSAEKEEPRLGVRQEEPGADREMPLAIGPRIHRAYRALVEFEQHNPGALVVECLLARPEHKNTVRRLQTMAQTPYGEIQVNLWHKSMKPMHLLRTKLSFFGASRFDPKSDRWVRVTLFQGAPLFEEFTHPSRDIAELDDWSFPIEPDIDTPDTGGPSGPRL